MLLEWKKTLRHEEYHLLGYDILFITTAVKTSKPTNLRHHLNVDFFLLLSLTA
jgi:hypothetical protein